MISHVYLHHIRQYYSVICASTRRQVAGVHGADAAEVQYPRRLHPLLFHQHLRARALGLLHHCGDRVSPLLPSRHHSLLSVRIFRQNPPYQQTEASELTELPSRNRFVRLRFTHPDMNRPYQVPGGKVVAFIFAGLPIGVACLNIAATHWLQWVIAGSVCIGIGAIYGSVKLFKWCKARPSGSRCPAFCCRR